MSDERAYTYIFSLPDSTERDIVKVSFAAADASLLGRFVACAETLLDTPLARQAFPTTINLEFADGQFSAQWKRPSDDEVAVYLHRYRPIGLNDEPTYFNKIANLMSRHVDSRIFRSSIAAIKDIFSGTYMQQNIFKVESNSIALNFDPFFMDWLNSYEYHRDQEKKERVDALHRIMPLDFTQAIMMLLMSEKTRAIARLAQCARAFS